MDFEKREALMYEWAAAETGRYSAPAANDDGERDPGDHPISRARQFAPGSRKRAALRLAGRDGQSRRRIMGDAIARAGVQGIHTAPKWASDPIRCTETRTGGPAASIDRGIPQHLAPVARAVRALSRENELRGLIIRMQYCWFGTQVEKAEKVAGITRETISVDRYKRELKAARERIDQLLAGAA